MDTMTTQDKLNTWGTVRKTRTKTHTVNVSTKYRKEFITFDYYKSLLVGKYDLTYFKTWDLILDVQLDRIGWFLYTVKDVKSGDVRTHGTFIHPSEVKGAI